MGRVGFGRLTDDTGLDELVGDHSVQLIRRYDGQLLAVGRQYHIICFDNMQLANGFVQPAADAVADDRRLADLAADNDGDAVARPP